MEVRQSFSFASPVEIVRALQLYCTSHYGAVLWDLQGEGAAQYCNAWTTAIKLAWDCPRATRTFLVQQVLACGGVSAKTEIMARLTRFFRSLRSSPSREVATLANLLSRDIRSTLGRNIKLISELSSSNLWTDSPASVRRKLSSSEKVTVFSTDKWRVGYLGTLLEQRQTWHYMGDIEQENEIQKQGQTLKELKDNVSNNSDDSTIGTIILFPML